ncbi:MAG: peptidylprolyl isomerase [Candidatus Eisenbacteria bacterium]
MFRPRCFGIATVLLATIVLVGPEVTFGDAGSNSAQPLATVNGETITTLDLDVLLASQPRPKPGEDVASLSPDGVLRRLVENRLIEQEGYRIEVDKRPEVRNQVWDLRRHKGMMALLDSVSRQERHAEDEQLQNALAETAIILRVSQILRKDEASALAMLDSLKAGIPFAELADKYSQDTTSVIQAGGDLGWARQDLFIPAFSEVLQTMSPGQVSPPIETERGWHILTITDWRSETAGQNEAMELAILEKAKESRVMGSIEQYVQSLMDKYDVKIDSTLLTTLDYGSDDAAVNQALQTSDALLVTMPWRSMTVRDFTMEIRFQHFHGLANKPDAAQLRDESLHEWVTELLLRHEASELGFDSTPALDLEAEAFERRLIRETVLGMVLDFKFAPTEDEVGAYYEEHLDAFRSAPEFRVDSVIFKTESAAQTFRQMLSDGATFNWLATNTPAVAERKPESLSGWMQPSYLDMKASQVQRGAFFGPHEMGEFWAVGEIIDVKESKPMQLNDCRNLVLQAMRQEQMQTAVQRAIQQLRDDADIEILDGARQLTAARTEAWLGRPLDMP